MLKRISILLIIIFTVTGSVSAEVKTLKLEQSDTFEIVKVGDKYITYVVGRVLFKTETGYIHCDSARWDKGKQVVLNGRVLIDEEDYRITADSIDYNLDEEEYYAFGKKVELWSYKDSLMAVGKYAYFSQNENYFTMDRRPTLYLKYPDSLAMFEIVADEIEYETDQKDARAIGDVVIASKEFSSQSGCAKMNTHGDYLDLYEKPKVSKEESTIGGELISIYFKGDDIDFIDVIDSAVGDFREPTDSTNIYFDQSKLKGNRLKIFFNDGLMDNIVCYGQAYSWFYPSKRGGTESHENSVSGDTIKLFIDQETINKVHVIGGAIGQYKSAKPQVVDSSVIEMVDTIDYRSAFIEYAITDSLITLKKQAHVQSGLVSLDAHHILFDTEKDIIEAFSADVTTDTIVNPYLLSHEVQPNVIPVVLKDKSDEILGDYLIYSIDTEKGRIIQSKTDFDKGYYYGKNLYREQKDIFYVDEGRFTTCSADEPHFHFKSTHMKLIEDDKLIAKPVVFYVEKIPLLALPYYVFSLKKGRHSGFLPFTFGKFERGERYIKNLGYYWAASDYWDWKGSVDYYDNSQRITFNNQINYNIRYLLNGYVTGSWTKETNFDGSRVAEFKKNRWVLRAGYNHTVTPSFSVRATGDFVSDATYYQDLSQNYDDITNRNTKSQISFVKKFGSATSLSGNITHNVDLDRESRTDNIPNMSLSLPTLYPFGNGSKDKSGILKQKWYHKFSFRYSPRLENFSSRITNKTPLTDTVITYDPISGVDDTTITIDTLSERSRKKYSKISHNPSINLPQLKLGNYMNVIPSFRYSETWFKIYETDQSIESGIDASTTYRTYSYRTSVAANTKLYGTIYPNIFGLVGLRHVFNPSIEFSYSPEINRHPEIRKYAGGGSGSSKQRTLNVNLSQLFQAKIKKGEKEQSYQLLSFNSGFSYNFENEEKPYSNLSTSFHISQLPLISSLDGSMVHSFYNPDSDELEFWSPFLESFNIRTNLTLRGKNFLFDDDDQLPKGVDSASQLTQASSSNKGWSMNISYNYNESGRGQYFRKTSYLTFSLNFNLTPTTKISYSHNYSIHQNQTTRSTVNIVKKIHCWSGSLYWVPTGTNRGFGFKLFVTDMPAIKVDSNHDGFTESLRNY